MVFGFFRKRTRDAEVSIYSQIVAQARQPAFYQIAAVPDTIEGRYDLLVLHAVLLFRRLQTEGNEAGAFGQRVFDIFFEDMDGNLRELGVGDPRVPKKVRTMAEMFYGRAAAYSEPLDLGDFDGLTAALNRIFFPEGGNLAASRQLATYVVAAAGALGQQTGEEILAGTLTWPDPLEHLK